MDFKMTDGGRAAAGYTGDAGDCVVRAIAIAAEKPYQEVYDALTEGMSQERLKRKRGSPRNGVPRTTYERYLKSLGFTFIPTMTIGSGCKVHLRAEELPSGRIIARVSKHLVAVVDGVLHDNHNPSRGGTRCVYGYFQKLRPLPAPLTPEQKKRNEIALETYNALGEVRKAFIFGAIKREYPTDAPEFDAIFADLNAAEAKLRALMGVK